MFDDDFDEYRARSYSGGFSSKTHLVASPPTIAPTNGNTSARRVSLDSTLGVSCAGTGSGRSPAEPVRSHRERSASVTNPNEGAIHRIKELLIIEFSARDNAKTATAALTPTTTMITTSAKPTAKSSYRRRASEPFIHNLPPPFSASGTISASRARSKLRSRGQSTPDARTTIPNGAGRRRPFVRPGRRASDAQIHQHRGADDLATATDRWLALTSSVVGLSRQVVRSFKITSKGSLVFEGYALPSLSPTGRRPISEQICTGACGDRNGSVHKNESTTHKTSKDSVCTRNVDISPTQLPSPPSFHRSYVVVMLGSGGVGCSSILSMFLSPDSCNGPEMTEDVQLLSDETDLQCSVSVVLDDEYSTMEFSQPQFSPTTLTAIVNSINRHTDDSNVDDVIGSNHVTVDACLLVYSVEDRKSFEAAIDCLFEIRRMRDKDDGMMTAIILVANKTDLVRTRVVQEEEGLSTAKTYKVKYIEVSAAIGHNIDKLLIGTLQQIRLYRRQQNSHQLQSDYFSQQLHSGNEREMVRRNRARSVDHSNCIFNEYRDIHDTSKTKITEQTTPMTGLCNYSNPMGVCCLFCPCSSQNNSNIFEKIFKRRRRRSSGCRSMTSASSSCQNLYVL